MRFTLVSIILVLLTGCSTKPVKLHESTNINSSDFSYIVSECSKECEQAVQSEGQFNDAISPAFGTSISNITIQSVNEKEGTTNFTSDCGGSNSYNVLNSYWDWSFNLEVEPGISVVDVLLSDCNIVNPNKYKLKLDLKASHRYALIAVSRKVKGSGFYDNQAIEWYPVLYDYNSAKILMGINALGWLKP